MRTPPTVYTYVLCNECNIKIPDLPGAKYVFLNGIRVKNALSEYRMGPEIEKSKDCYICFDCWKQIAPERLMLDLDK